MLLLYGILIGASLTATAALSLLITRPREAYQRGLEAGAMLRLADDEVGIQIVRPEPKHRQRR